MNLNDCHTFIAFRNFAKNKLPSPIFHYIDLWITSNDADEYLLLVLWRCPNIKQQKKSTLQSIKNHKKQNFFENIGQSDITSLVNFKLLKEYLHKKDLDVSNIVTQSFFLKRVGILNRAEILSNKLRFRQKAYLYIRLKRLFHQKIMVLLYHLEIYFYLLLVLIL